MQFQRDGNSRCKKEIHRSQRTPKPVERTEVESFCRRKVCSICKYEELKKGVRIYERNSFVDTKVSGGGVPGTRAEIPLQPIVKTMVRQVDLT